MEHELVVVRTDAKPYTYRGYHVSTNIQPNIRIVGSRADHPKSDWQMVFDARIINNQTFHRALVAAALPPYPKGDIATPYMTRDGVPFLRFASESELSETINFEHLNTFPNLPSSAAAFAAKTTVFDFDDRTLRVANAVYACGSGPLYRPIPKLIEAIVRFGRRAEFLTPSQVYTFLSRYLPTFGDVPSAHVATISRRLEDITCLADAAELIACSTESLAGIARKHQHENGRISVAYTDFAKKTGLWHLVLPAIASGVKGKDLFDAVSEIDEVLEAFTADGETMYALVEAHFGKDSPLGKLARYRSVDAAVARVCAVRSSRERQ